MISAFECAAIFRIQDEASLTLKKISDAIKVLSGEMKALADQGKALGESFRLAFTAMDTGIATSTKEVSALAAEWKLVEGATIKAAEAAKVAGVGTVGGGGRGGRGNPRTRIGGSHGHTAALVAAGALGVGMGEEAELEDAQFQIEFHAGLKKTPENDKMIRGLIQKTSADTGFGYKDVAEAATDEVRLLKGSPGNGIDILPEMLIAAAKEAKAKGIGLKEAMRSLIEMAHMTREYDLPKIQKLMPLYAFLSTANPATLPQMVRAASYAMPTLQANLGMDPADVLYETTAIARAGATNTKSGTWVRSAFEHSLPPREDMVSKSAYEKTTHALRELGLVDENNKSTVLDPTGKHLDVEKLLKTVYDHTKDMPIIDQNSFFKRAFGEQGARGMSLMMQPGVREQTGKLKEQFPDFKNQYDTFLEDYKAQSPIQQFRTTTQDLMNVLADIGTLTLPTVVKALRIFDATLVGIISHLPGGKTGRTLATGAVGAVAGATAGGILGYSIGKFGGPTTALAGAGAGALIGADTALHPGLTGGGFLGAIEDAIKLGGAYLGLGGNKPAAAPEKQSFNAIPPPQGQRPIVLSSVINLDGQTIADTVESSLAASKEHPTTAPYADSSRYAWDGGMQVNTN